MNKLLIVSALLLSHVGLMASEILQSDDKGVRYRQSAYFILRTNTGPLAAMARGKMDYDEAMFKKYAARVGMIAEFVPDGFEEPWMNGSSEAKKAIWENKDDFNAKMNDFLIAARALAETAKLGDQKANINAFKDLGKTCKACHDKYKAD